MSLVVRAQYSRLRTAEGHAKTPRIRRAAATLAWMVAYAYRQEVLDRLADHGLRPLPSTTPGQLRDALRDLYKYEIKVLRAALLDGHIPKADYANHVVALRKRYWLLSVPVQLWTAE
jgi:hypothetical protein